MTVMAPAVRGAALRETTGGPPEGDRAFADFHIHTRFSRDSILAEDKFIRIALERGLNTVAITNHNNVEGAIAVQRRVAELGVADRLRFVGRRQPDELRFYYGAGDIAVTTPWYEPFGLTPLEGMACGRPVVGSAVGGIAFTIVDGVTGFLVPPRDPEALADRLQDLLAQPDLRARLGRAARTRVEREFTWPTVAARTAALY